MAHWKDLAKICGDVIFFQYVKEEKEKEAQEVYVWDLDKTYLDTQFASFSEILRTAMEKAFQKRNVPGTKTLVRVLRTIQGQIDSKEAFQIYFITASPPQMERKIYEKLRLDGIAPFGSFFKDNLKNLHPQRWWRLTQQVGYKLQALLQLRSRLHSDVRQILWGDDSESDAVIYSLYSDFCSRRRSVSELRNILKYFRVTGEQTDIIFALQSQIPEQDPIDKIYINLAVDTDPEYYSKFGRRMLPIYNSFQVALDLFQDGRIESQQVILVAQDLAVNYGFTSDEMEQSLDDLIRRNVIGEETSKSIIPALTESHVISTSFNPTVVPLKIAERKEKRVYSLEGQYEPWIPEHIDYVHDYR